jgi:DNA-directed RNA polymerase subunit RPC12/RpoP
MIWYIVYALVLIIAAFPFRNWLEIRGIKAKDAKWSAWLLEKPSREEYCQASNQNIDDIKCNYCSSDRQFSNLLATIPYQPKFGIMSNTLDKQSFFRTYICSGCGTQLYRERYER